MLIDSFGVILISFYCALHCVVRADGMIRAGVFIVTTIGDGAVILRATLGDAGVSTLGGDGSLTLFSRDVCTSL